MAMTDAGHGPKRYVSRPVEIEAMQFLGGNADAVRNWMRQRANNDGLSRNDREGPYSLWVEKSLAWCEVAVGDFIIKEPDGQGFYPCVRAIFEDRYDAADNGGPT